MVEADPALATVAAAIAMRRFPPSVTADHGVAAISPDGTRLATVVWEGDLLHNVNVYSLLVIDVARALPAESPDVDGAGSADDVEPAGGLHPGPDPEPVLSVGFPGDPDDQTASPISQITFAGGNDRVAFLGSLEGEPRQVYAIDLATGDCETLTDHPLAVRSFALRPDGSLALFTVAGDDPDDHRGELAETDGLLVMDDELFPDRPDFMSGYLAVRAERPRATRRYYLASPDDEPVLIFDSAQSRPRRVSSTAVGTGNGLDRHHSNALTTGGTLDDEYVLSGISTIDAAPTGKHALLWPYALTDEPVDTALYEYYRDKHGYHEGLAARYGLVDLESGAIEMLIDAPHPCFERDAGRPIWAPDGRSAVIYTLLPHGTSSNGAGSLPAWVEVDIESRRATPLGLTAGWKVVAWNASLDALVLEDGDEFATIARKPDGSWGSPQPLVSEPNYQPHPEPVTNGVLVVGSYESSLQPPDLAVHQIGQAAPVRVTDLNRELRDQAWGEVEVMRWRGELTSSEGFLVKPWGYEAGERCPLAFLFDDGLLRRTSAPFLIDGGSHLSGHPIQALAARGIAVLFSREPSSLREVMETPDEGEYLRDHVESAIRHLDERGIVDTNRVGISGWSRAGFYTDYVLIHSSMPFAAATQIDGGTVDYLDHGRPFHDDELACIHTPVLLEAHGPGSFIGMAAMADRLNSLGGAGELLYFPKAPHSVITPRHRLRSLSVHLDWFCFWLCDAIDTDPAKARQYERWRALQARLGEAEVPAPASDHVTRS